LAVVSETDAVIDRNCKCGMTSTPSAFTAAYRGVYRGQPRPPRLNLEAFDMTGGSFRGGRRRRIQKLLILRRDFKRLLFSSGTQRTRKDARGFNGLRIFPGLPGDALLPSSAIISNVHHGQHLPDQSQI
jgi:hypothetical protein